MQVVIKQPGKEQTPGELTQEEIYDLVAPNDYPEFVTFNDIYNIGMYVHDSGKILGHGKNFVHNGSIIYGTVVFVGLDKEGKAIDISGTQYHIVKDYLEIKALR